MKVDTEASPMDTSRVHRQPATAITPLSIDAAETADGVPAGSWVTHTAKRTVYVRTAYLQNVLSHILENLRQRNVGRNPMGWMYVPWFNSILSLVPASSTLDELHLSRIRADVRKLEKKYLEMELWLLSR